MKGKVKWYNFKKGYGFIDGEDGQAYFAHFTAIPKGTSLRENDDVEFEPKDTDKGKQAHNVQVTKKASEKSPEELAESNSSDEQPKESTEETTEEEPQESTEETTEESSPNADEETQKSPTISEDDLNDTEETTEDKPDE